MAVTELSTVSNQVQKFWSPMFMDDLKENTLLPSLVNRDYEGEIKKGGDTVYVSQINRPSGERKTIGSGADTFSPELLSTTRVAIQANQRISASFEFEDVVDLQSQLGDENSAIRKGLMEAAEIQLNSYLYSLIAPSASAPDHVLTSVTDFSKAQLQAVRILAAQAKWKPREWYLLADPVYYGDMLDDLAAENETGAGDSPIVGGQFAVQRYGFNILEDNSAGLLTLSSTGQDAAIAFHPDFMALVMQKQPTFKVSDLHSNKQFGYVISVDMIVGAALLPDGANKHISIINS